MGSAVQDQVLKKYFFLWTPSLTQTDSYRVLKNPSAENLKIPDSGIQGIQLLECMAAGGAGQVWQMR